MADVIAKRKARWAEKEDLAYDTELVRAAARLILSNEALVREVRERPYLLIEACFHIVDKKRDTVPFFFNEVQRDFIAQYERYGTDKPYFILKGRQQGFTSLITAMQLAAAITTPNFAGMTLADKADNTRAIFNDKARMVYERLPDELKPTERFNSKNELFFDKLNASWRVSTATEQVGRSRTLNFVHFSEVAFYQCPLASLQKGIGEAITADAFRIYETTANGFNEARELWVSGTCHNIFYEWWRTAEYRTTDDSYLENAADPWLLSRLDLLREKGLDREQLAWYAKKYAGYLDKNTIKQEYPCSPDEAFISSGYPVFDREAAEQRLLELDLSGGTPGRRVYFTYQKTADIIRGPDGSIADTVYVISDIAFKESPDGYITLHEEPRVKRNARGEVTHQCPYALGGDTAGTGIDYYTAKVVDGITGNTVATLRQQRIDEDKYAEQVYCLGKYYHTALVGIETNYSRVPTRHLERLSYPEMYMRERFDRSTKEIGRVAGFETTRQSKHVVVWELVRLFRDNPKMECDCETLKEMLTFVKRDNGEPAASAGAHDDLVMALAIAHAVKEQGHTDWQPFVGEEDHFLEEHFHGGENFSFGGGYDNSGYVGWDDM